MKVEIVMIMPKTKLEIKNTLSRKEVLILVLLILKQCWLGLFLLGILQKADFAVLVNLKFCLVDILLVLLPTNLLITKRLRLTIR